MFFYADLHIHSRFSRATSRECTLPSLALWARKKGLTVLGTGDFTHPGCRAELEEQLEPAEPGLFRLKPELEREVEKQLAPGLRGPVRFLLTVEISTIYKKAGAVRKIHHLIAVPDFASVQRLVKKLSPIGNLEADGRPILGLDSRDLLEMTLEAGEGAYLIPAHIWTPWFSVLGSQSGFDFIEECYADLTSHIFALETGLSSDPGMNWRLSALDRFRLVSNSDSHSPMKLGREACIFDTELDYFALRQSLETGTGFLGTIEFFPEEGKYHLDGHRKCQVRLSPGETREHQGRCPACGRRVTVGVMNRVEELADRPQGFRPETAAGFRSLIPLAEVLAEIQQCGPNTAGVLRLYETLLARLGPELFLLDQASLEDVRAVGSDLLAEALARMRAGQVQREPGYDGEYGIIRLFAPEELRRTLSLSLLFPLEEEAAPAPGEKQQLCPAPRRAAAEEEALSEKLITGVYAPEHSRLPRAESRDEILELDPDQAAAMELLHGPLLIVAGPGTGKTRTLTHRIARLVASGEAAPEECLALTFSRRAATEMRERLDKLLPEFAGRFPVMTFHRLGFTLLREYGRLIGLPGEVRVIDEVERGELLAKAWPRLSPRQREKMAAEISRFKRSGGKEPPEKLVAALARWEEILHAQVAVDFDDLLLRSLELFQSHPDILSQLRKQWPWVSIDEYQDIDELQYRLVRLLCPPSANLCAIGDPDQAIYGFRGADVSFFLRFQQDYPGARVIRLRRNYRSLPVILQASAQMIAPVSLAPGRELIPGADAPGCLVIHTAPSERAEAEFVVHTIEQLLGGSTFFSHDSGRLEGRESGEYSLSDFGVLYRMEAQAGALMEAFARSGIPFQQLSHDRLSRVPAAARLLSFLRQERGEGLIADQLRRAVEGLSREEAGGATLAEGEEETGAPAAVDWETALELLLPLAEECGSDRFRFFSEAALAAAADLWDRRVERISLLTLHAAKGLEFRVVFIVGCEDGIIPLRFGKTLPGGEEEERRLFFVGMTRAREQLFLVYARRRRWHGRVRERRLSPFVSAIEERLLVEEKSRLGRRGRKKDNNQLKLF